ncbi:YlbL family protein [Paenibacillus koleovorans]|uniref:YlbL family protein n=1 Tax=Paenibacillus koleovorans TaxID=121608 RepID=UPI0013E3E92A|nr:PDZ domain-containing protein [Paenibacillus koleovorans]
MKRRKSFLQRWPLWLLLLLILASVNFVSLPYYVEIPGSTEPLDERVIVQGKTGRDQGELMFTTVFSLSASPYTWLYGKLAPHAKIVPKQTRLGRVRSPESYQRLLEWMRDDSEASAMIAALRVLNKPVQLNYEGVIIQYFLENAPSAKLLYEGDIVTAVEGSPVKTTDDLKTVLAGKKPGDKAAVTVKRGSRTETLQVPLMELDDAAGKRTGFGFGYSTVQVPIHQEDIRFDLNDIGGPSAGFMIALEIVSQYEGGTLPRGYKVAGTGTVDADGTIGQIGGIDHKIITAAKSGADYFILPRNVNPTDRNETDARAAYEKLGKTKMQLLPVSTLAEAVETLKKLPAASPTGSR